MRYYAFLSYSHRDKAETEWLHRSLERYKLPKRLIGTETRFGPVPPRVSPVFRDRDELGAADDLGEQLRDSLQNSRFLIVIASPAASSSKWVNEEILSYKRIHGEGHVLALIVDGEPYASSLPGREAEEAFPEALRYRIGPNGKLTSIPAEPIAADIRPGKDGKRLGLLKLVAGITGLRLDDLVQREAQRRANRLKIIATAASTGMVFATGLAFYANQQRLMAVEQRNIAERETAAARAATDYLIGTFELTDPATENPRTVSLVTILARGAERARTELKAQPEIEARLVTAVGRAYTNLGLLSESETALSRAMPAIERAGPAGAPALMALASNHLRQGEPDRALDVLNKADKQLGVDNAAHAVTRAILESQRGNIAYINGDPEAALELFDKALATLKQDTDPDPRDLASIIEGRGKALIDLGRYDEAEAALQEANALYRRYRGEYHLATGRSLYSLAMVAYGAGKYPEAERRIEKSLEILRRVLDRTNPMLADALSLKGSILQAEGRLGAADAALDEAIKAYREVYKSGHYNIGIAEYYRAQIAIRRGRLHQALEHLDRAQHNYIDSYGSKHANIGEVMVTRAGILQRMGEHENAVLECSSGLHMLNETVGPNHSFTQGLRESCEIIKGKSVNTKN